jgi:hypothetical protein
MVLGDGEADGELRNLVAPGDGEAGGKLKNLVVVVGDGEDARV